MKAKMDIRPSPLAGQWYPADSQRLAEEVDHYLDAAQLPDIQGEVVAVMAPHAGHRYSGPVAGFSFASVRGRKPEVVTVVSPMHHPYYEALITTAHEAYWTPLGAIPVDLKALDNLDQELKNQLGQGLARLPYDPEHSLEIELPFLQRALQDEFMLIPVMMRDQSAHTARSLGLALAKVLRQREQLLVASSDLSHFYPQRMAELFDRAFLEQVEAFDPHGVLNIEEEGKGFACGRAAVSAVLWAARELGANHVQILSYATSGDVTGDYDRVVGYGSAVITKVHQPQD